ncbi:MAG: hypothetical protein ACOH19_11610 [Rhodoglobus sp.]
MNDAEALAETIEVVQGRRALDPQWIPLVEAFATKYGMTIVNVTTDDVAVGGSRGRLRLWGATASDAKALQRPSGNYDPKKQARANALAPGGPWFVFSEDYETEAFRAFVARGGTPALRVEARMLLADDRIWEVDTSLGRIVIFVYTDEQRNNVSPTDRDAWENALWAWFSSLNPPGLARRERFRVEVDSKQNLDENYEGISFYYWR